MAKLTWNSFVSQHQNPYGFATAISAALPNGPHFDSGGKKLPTPYSLFLEWASRSLSGDWSSTKYKGGFIICVESKNDADQIAKTFGAAGPSRKTQACARTVSLGYKDSDYKSLATRLGYKL